jgi:hypothetical protein
VRRRGGSWGGGEALELLNGARGALERRGKTAAGARVSGGRAGKRETERGRENGG